MEHFPPKIWIKRFWRPLAMLLLFVSAASALVQLTQAAGTPAILSYQGRLANANGDLLGGSGTTYYFKFSIWDNATVNSGTKLWPTSAPTSYSTTVRDGVFNVNIGDTANGYPDALTYNFNTNPDVYLQVEVSSNDSTFETLSPRQRISSTAFTRLSGAVSGTGQSSFGTTTPFAASVVSIEATSTDAVGLSIRGIVSQAVNLFQIQNSSGTNLLVVDKDGKVGLGTSTATRIFNVLNTASVPQVRVSQTESVYGETYVDSAGDVRISSTGGNIRQNDENLWVCASGSCGATAPSDKGNIVVETSVIFDGNLKLKQVAASSSVIMYDTGDNVILQFDEQE